jgi:hypothetical protein
MSTSDQKVRVQQKCVLYPYFDRVGKKVAVFYDYILFESGDEWVRVPWLAESFVSIGYGCEVTARTLAHRAIYAKAAERTGWPADPNSGALSVVPDAETRECVWLPDMKALREKISQYDFSALLTKRAH